MTYKTILVHVDQSRHAEKRFKIAAELALAENAHLIGAAMTGISRFVYQPDGKLDLADSVVATQVEALTGKAKEALSQFKEFLKKMPALSYEARLVNDEPEGGLALQARYADLVVVGQTDADESSPGILSDLPEYVMLNCARPVLIVPNKEKIESFGVKVLLAWDGSLEATRAFTNAIPLLQRAEKVTVGILNPSAAPGIHGEEPGADIGLYLARHGIKIDVANVQTKFDIASALLLLSQDLGSDLIVMGGYGHTRFREVLLGGATLSMLRKMTVPVLISH